LNYLLKDALRTTKHIFPYEAAYVNIGRQMHVISKYLCEAAANNPREDQVWICFWSPSK